MYDVLIKNGEIADGVRDELFSGDVAITGDRIVAVGGEIDPARAAAVIDATGKIVAPGFVDVHSHSDYYLLIDSRAESKLLQGVTTEVGGNCGYAAAPMAGEMRKTRAQDYKEQFGLDVAWGDLDAYFARLEAARPAVNFAALIGYNTVRGSVMGMEDRAPTPKEMGRIKEMIARNLDQGAIGMSVGVVYPPACFATEGELIEAFRVVAEKGKVFTSHIRSEGMGLLDALTEVTTVAERSGARLQVSHLKTAGKKNWPKMEKAFAILEGARARGVKLMADRYPYLASNTGLSVVLPDRAFDGGRDRFLGRLADRAERKKFREEILANHPEESYWDEVMVSQVVNEKNRDLQGKTVSEGARLRGKEWDDFIFDLLIEEEGGVEAIYFCMSPDNLDAVLQKPWVVIGSDAGARNIDGPLALGYPHPRTYGSFPKFFREWVRERTMFTIPEAVKKTSGYGCEFFGIADRGRLVENFFADVVVFDPDTIGDTSSYEKPLSYPVGIDHVFVNGCHAVKKGVSTNSGAGRVVK